MSQRKQQQARVGDDAVARWGMGIVSAITGLTGFAVLTNLYEPFQQPKLAVLVIGALVLVTFAAWSATTTASVAVPRGWALRVGGGALAVLVLTSLLNDRRALSFWGELARSAGVLAYLAAAVLFVAVCCWGRVASIERLAWVVLGSSVPVIGIALLEMAGKRPIGDFTEEGWLASTLGQPNFVSGFAGILLPLAVWAAWRHRSRVPVALAALALAVATLAVLIDSASFQGLPAGVAGTAVVVWIALLQQVGWRRARWVAVAVVAVGLVVGVVGRAHFEAEVRNGLDERVLIWQAAFDMVVERPILGSGMAGFTADFSEHRPREHADRFGLFTVADAPHSTPLGMFVAGGALLGVLYLGFVAAVGYHLVRGLRRTTGDVQLLLAGVGGVWLAYQVQSIVSIEMPALLALHAVSAGAVLVVSGGVATRNLTLSGLAPRRRGRTTGPNTAAIVVRVAAVVVVLAGAWILVRPLAADRAYRLALDAMAAGDVQTAIAKAGDATDGAPWVGRYWAMKAAALGAAGRTEDALDAGERAADLAPSAVTYALTAGQVAHELGRDEDADRWFASAVRHSPWIADPMRARAEYLLDVERFDDARDQLEEAIEIAPTDAGLFALLGAAEAGAGDEAAAEAAYRKALELDPANAEALAALGEGAP